MHVPRSQSNPLLHLGCTRDSMQLTLQAGSYTNYFADALIAEAELDSRVVGIHAAMGGGTGMNRFEQRYPERTFDVGIAEQVRPCTPSDPHQSLHRRLE